MVRYRVWVPAHAFLYLPLYALRDLGVLRQVAEALGVEPVSIEIVPSSSPYEPGCVQHMLARAEAPSAAIELAVGDPLAAFEADPEGHRARMLGAFIKRPPFWVLGRFPKPTEGVAVRHRVVCYKDLVTGRALGRRLAEKPDFDEELKLVEFGAEVDTLFDPCSETIQGRLRVVTADVIGVVRAQRQDPTVEIIAHLSAEYPDFVTTGLCAHLRTLEEHEDQIAVFMEALRTACVLVQTAPTPTATLIQQLSKGDEFRDQIRVSGAEGGKGEGLSLEESQEVAALLFQKPPIYDGGIPITSAEWKGSIGARGKDWDPAKTKKAHRFYRLAYDRRPGVKKLEQWLALFMRDYSIIATEKRAANRKLAAMSVVVIVLGACIAALTAGDSGSAELRKELLLGVRALTVFAFYAGAYASFSSVLKRAAARLPMQALQARVARAGAYLLAGAFSIAASFSVYRGLRPETGGMTPQEFWVPTVSGLVFAVILSLLLGPRSSD